MRLKKTGFSQVLRSASLTAGALVLFCVAHAAAATRTHAPSASAAVSAVGVYRAGQKWIVPGEWEFTVDSARVANVRIPNRGGGSWVPRQVIVLTYSYKNIGFHDSAQGTHGGQSTLAFSKAHINLVDANDARNVGAGNYPVPIRLVEDADGQTLGQQMVGAQWPYAFKKKATAVKVKVSHYDSKLELHEATFLVPVGGTRPSKSHANKQAHRT